MKWNENKYDMYFIVNVHDNGFVRPESWTKSKLGQIKSDTHNRKFVKSVLIGAFPCTRSLCVCIACARTIQQIKTNNLTESNYLQFEPPENDLHFS